MRFNKLYDLLMERLKIVAPAIKVITTKNGKPHEFVVPGKVGEMHANVYDRFIMRLAKLNNIQYKKAEKYFYRLDKEGKVIDGFIDNEGNFQSREDAWKIAKGYDKEIENQDKDLSKREDGEHFKRLSSEWIPQTGPAYKALDNYTRFIKPPHGE